MKKLCFAWGIALVVTVALLGVSAANPFGGAPVADDEAALIVGGQVGCGCLGAFPCDGTGGCSGMLYFGTIRCNLPNTVGYSPTKCGPTTGCNNGWYSYGPCVATATVTNPQL
jgi:hypothetical protein